MTTSPTPRPADKPSTPDRNTPDKKRPEPTGKVQQPGNPSGWVGLAVAVVVTFMQAAFNYTVPGVADSESPARAVLLFLSLIGSVVAAVLGVVSLASKRAPQWPATAALAVGLSVFLVTVAAWVGSLVAEA
ncbi:MAG: hypothetical protein ACQERF_03890 [Actinomycetota bacterium]